MCEFCNTKFYVQVERYSKPILAPLTEVEELECELINKTGFQYMQIQNNYCPLCRKEAGRVKRYASGYWYQFIIPRRLTLPPTRIYRWLNFFWRLKDKEESYDK